MARWIPLFQDLLDSAVAGLAEGSVVCVVGAMGSGKSVFLSQVSERLQGSPAPVGSSRTLPRSVRRVRGVPALRGVPGGALGEGWTPGVVHLVDDADEIDEVSAARLRVIADEASDPVLLSFSARRRLPEAFAAMIEESGATILRLPELDLDGARDLMGAVLDARVEAASAARALAWGAGTPLGVSRYAELAREEGALVDSGSYVAVDRRFTPGPSTGASDASAHHRYRLPADDRVAVRILEYVAVARALPYSVLLDMAAGEATEETRGRAAVRDLLDRGVLVEVHEGVPGGAIRFSHPSAAWAVRDDLGGMGRLSVVGAVLRHAGPRDRWPDSSWVALVAKATRSGLEVPPEDLVDAIRVFARMTVGDQTTWADVGNLLVDALPADMAASAPDDVVTDLADIAVALHKAVDVRRLIDLLAPAVAAGHVAATFATAYLHQDALGDTVGASFLLGEAASAAREAGRTADADALSAGRLALIRRAGGTYPDDDEVALPEGAPRVLAAQVAVTDALDGLWEGRLIEAATGLGVFGDPTPGGCEAVAVQGEVLPVSALMSMAWGLPGGGDHVSPWAWLPQQQVNVHAGVGIYLYERGSAGAALESFEQALSATVPTADAAIVPHLHRWAAAAAGRAGRHEEAVAHLAEFRASAAAGRALEGVLGGESARLELAAAASAPPEEFAAAVATAERAVSAAVERGRHLVAANLLWELWRCGAEVDRTEWAELATRVDGDLPAAVAAFVAALRDGDGEAVLATVPAFEKSDRLAAAAEVASTGAELMRRADEKAEATRAAAESLRFLDELGEVVLPRTGVRTPDDPRLTEREREIATMVARGMSNAAIAAELVLSTRTIDSHLYRLLGKLEIADRRQLRLPRSTGIGSTGSLASPIRDR